MAAPFKISELIAATDLQSADQFVVARTGTNRKVSGDLVGGGWIAATGQTWSYGSVDGPTFTFTISGDYTTIYSPGMRIRLSQTTGGIKYGIVTKVAYGAPNTTVTMYMGTNYTLVNETISSPCYSSVAAPYGFLRQADIWTTQVTDNSFRTQNNPAQNTWYNVFGSIDVPIGSWILGYCVQVEVTRASNGPLEAQTTLSTGNNNESDAQLSCWAFANNDTICGSEFGRERAVTVASKTPYYLNHRTGQTSCTSVSLRNNNGLLRLYARSAYL